jgi:hypothetical protein
VPVSVHSGAPVSSSRLHVAFTIIALITLGKAPLLKPLRNPDVEVTFRLAIVRDDEVKVI